MCLDVANATAAPSSNILLWTGNSNSLQTFKFLEYYEVNTEYVKEGYNGWYRINNASYWYDDGIMARDKEVYDPESDAWYWFDADGRMAVDKDAFIPTNADRTEGKWVRYDENGSMKKGEDYRYGGWYWFDPVTGEMIKGFVYIPVDGASEGKWVYYDEITGQMHHGESCIDGNWYYFDEYTGKMAHGESYHDGNWYYYDEITGIMRYGEVTLPNGETAYYDEITGVRR
jgi:glucan-binding YG repeat protein